jgi:hypothetical protein
VASRNPDTRVVELNTCPEALSNMPRREKCRCHQSGSVVVSTATSTPVARIMMAARAK